MASLQKPNSEEIKALVRQALKEDLGGGDITTDSILIDPCISRAEALAKESLVLCGSEIFQTVFFYLNSKIQVHPHFKDGDFVQPGSIIFSLKGDAAAILKGERTALNLLQHLSGIATKTQQFVNHAKPVKVLDTRKTHAGLRRIEKYAVACGGGENHRLGLFDAVLIKDNHIRAAGSISKAIARVRNALGPDRFIEVEVADLDELREALASKSPRILLDNMSIDSIGKAVEIVAGQAEIEVSGSLTLGQLQELSQMDIDYVSIGGLTHSAPWVDISLNFID